MTLPDDGDKIVMIARDCRDVTAAYSFATGNYFSQRRVSELFLGCLFTTNRPDLRMDNIPDVFEGVEKRIEIRFAEYDLLRNGLRSLSREIWNEFCSKCRCTIIHHDNTEFYDSYILSESSLFVFGNKVMIKTCGTTVPLEGVDFLVVKAREIGLLPTDMTYTRSSFLFPDLQVYPHNDLDREMDYLSKMVIDGVLVPGNSSILGDANGKYWFAHYKKFQPTSVAGDTTVVTPPNASRTFSIDGTGSEHIMVDVIMTGIDKDICAIYHKDPLRSDDVNSAIMGESLRGIIPDFKTISGKCYDPCGYSCNAFDDDRYLTVHITPEDAFSYASVEAVFPCDVDSITSLDRDNLALNHSISGSTVASDLDPSSTITSTISNFIQNVISTFRPQEALVTTLYRVDATGHDFESPVSQLPTYFSVNSSTGKSKLGYSQAIAPISSQELLGEDIVASSVFYSTVSSGGTGNKPPGLS